MKAFRLLVNRSVTWAAWDDELLALELQELNEAEFDLSLTGFDPKEILGLTLAYDAENRQVAACTVDCTVDATCLNQAGTGRTLYIYDAAGQRVQKQTTSGPTTYVYDAFGNLAAEYGGNPVESGTQYIAVDHCRSARGMSTRSALPKGSGYWQFPAVSQCSRLIAPGAERARPCSPHPVRSEACSPCLLGRAIC